MVLINLDLLNNLDYTESDERFVKWLKFLNSKSLTELYEVSKGDDILMSSYDYINWYLSSENNTRLEDKLRETENKGRKAGKKAGIIETAKNMLIDGMSTNQVNKYTGISLKELNKLKKSL